MEERIQTPLQQPQTSEFNVLYDVVQLPSKGIFYDNKKSSVYCEHMTAKDEQILLSPELLKKNIAYEHLLKRKIKDKDIEVSKLTVGDQNAILLFLRCSAYGYDYNIKLISPYTLEEFDTVVDLSKIGYKELVLPDTDGLYTYKTKDNKHVIRFKILTAEEENTINAKSDALKKQLSINELPLLRLNWQIISLDGNPDKIRIKNFIELSKPALIKEIKKYIDEVTPGLDMKYTFNCPFTGEDFQTIVPITTEFFYPES